MSLPLLDHARQCKAMPCPIANCAQMKEQIMQMNAIHNVAVTTQVIALPTSAATTV